jgi:hypothetical protein
MDLSAVQSTIGTRTQARKTHGRAVFGFEISSQQSAFWNEDLQCLDINIEDVNLRLLKIYNLSIYIQPM